MEWTRDAGIKIAEICFLICHVDYFIEKSSHSGKFHAALRNFNIFLIRFVKSEPIKILAAFQPI